MKWLLISEQKPSPQYLQKNAQILKPIIHNQMNFFKFKPEIQKKILFRILFLLIFFSFIPVSLNCYITSKERPQLTLQSHSGEITIKITGTGDQYIIGEQYNICPDAVHLNGEAISTKEDNCKIITIDPSGNTQNTVKLTYTTNLISLSGMFSHMRNLLEIDFTKYDTSSIVYMNDLFYNTTSIKSINLSNLDTSSLEDMKSMFYDCNSLIDLDLTGFDTSKVTNMSFVFYGCKKLKSLDISSFVTSEVISMEAMFYQMHSLEKLDLSNFDTSKVIEMGFMFYECQTLTSLDLKSFNTSSVTDMSVMFYQDINLRSLDLSHLDTSKVTAMNHMFIGCTSLTSVDVSNFDTSNVNNMNFMFYNCGKLESLDLSSFKTPNLQSMYRMFFNCQALTSLDVSNFDTSQINDMNALFYQCHNLISLNISSFDTSNVQDMEFMFYDCATLDSLDLSNFDTSSVKAMGCMFYQCSSLLSLDLSNFDTSEVETMQRMFYHCEQLTSVDLSSFDTNSITSFDYMFLHCYSLTSLNLSNFETPNLSSMYRMFDNCISLESLDVSNFNTGKITNMELLFYNCQNLLSLDLSNFDTAKVNNMNGIFAQCLSLTSLDVSSFDTSQVTTMRILFYKCYELQNLDISNFDTHSVQNMYAMFADCHSLTSLDISNFDTSSVLNMGLMFSECLGISELNLSNFDISSVADMSGMFSTCENIEYINLNKYSESSSLVIGYFLNLVPENIVICIDENNNVDKIKEILSSKLCPSIDCSENWKEHKKKLIDGNNETCADDCSDFKYENNDICYATCPEGVDFCQPETTCIEAIKVPTTYVDTTNIDTTNIIITHKSEEKISTEYLKSYSTNNFFNKDSSSTDIAEQNHISEIVSSKNYLTNSLNIDTTHKEISMSSYIAYNSINKIDFSTEIIIKTEKTIKGENNEEIYHQIIDKLLEEQSNSEEGAIVEGKDDFIYQLTTSENEKGFLDGTNNATNKLSIIDLGECENILKDYYHINKSASLIILKFEKKTNISSERTLQYEVYNPFNKEKLNLSICDDTTIDIYIPVVLSEELQNLYNELKDLGYDLFDSNSPFYQDICTPFKSPDGTDVPLSDRYDYYFNNNETLCQSNCKFSEYSFESKYLKCECDVDNTEINTEIIEKFKPKNLYTSFYDSLKFSNYKVLKCYKLVFVINSITKNKGSIMVIIFFSLYLIFLLCYCCKGINQLKVDLAKKFLNEPFNQNNDTIKEKNFEFKEKVNNKQKNKTKSLTSRANIKTKKKVSIMKSKIINTKNFPPKKSILIKGKDLPKRKTELLKSRNVVIFDKKFSDRKTLVTNNKFNLSNQYSVNSNNYFSQVKENKNKTEKAEKTKDEKLDNFELNNLEFNLAKQLDKRDFLEIYWSLLRREHIIFFTFFVRNDYNIIYVKLARFIFLVCTDMTMNVFFFSDENMHKIFVNYGKYNFIQQIPQIIYSSLVSVLIDLLLCFLSLTDKHFYQIKNLEFNSRDKMFPIIRCIKIKLAFFFAFTIIFFVLYWYAIACFCAVYENSQVHFIKDSFSSFGFGLLYPFVLYLFPAALRIMALRACRLSCLYAISDIIPFF